MYQGPHGLRRVDPDLASKHRERTSILDESRAVFVGLGVAIALLVVATIIGHFL